MRSSFLSNEMNPGSARYLLVENKLKGMDNKLRGVDNKLRSVYNKLRGVDNKLRGVDKLRGVENKLKGVDNKLCVNNAFKINKYIKKGDEFAVCNEENCAKEKRKK